MARARHYPSPACVDFVVLCREGYEVCPTDSCDCSSGSCTETFNLSRILYSDSGAY